MKTSRRGAGSARNGDLRLPVQRTMHSGKAMPPLAASGFWADPNVSVNLASDFTSMAVAPPPGLRPRDAGAKKKPAQLLAGKQNKPKADNIGEVHASLLAAKAVADVGGGGLRWDVLLGEASKLTCGLKAKTVTPLKRPKDPRMFREEESTSASGGDSDSPNDLAGTSEDDSFAPQLHFEGACKDQCPQYTKAKMLSCLGAMRAFGESARFEQQAAATFRAPPGLPPPPGFAELPTRPPPPSEAPPPPPAPASRALEEVAIGSARSCPESPHTTPEGLLRNAPWRRATTPPLEAS